MPPNQREIDEAIRTLRWALEELTAHVGGYVDEVAMADLITQAMEYLGIVEDRE